MNRRLFLLSLCIAVTPSAAICQAPESYEADICVYGGTSAAVTAAVEAARMGHSVVMVSPDKHLGGLTSSGLGWTDFGDSRILGGLAREFYHRLWEHYQSPNAWTQQTRDSFGNRGQGGPGLNDELEVAVVFEPHVAEQTFDSMIAEHGVTLVRARLQLNGGVSKRGASIRSIRTEDGRTITARVFIDATYEGDLMAKSGVSYTVGREANSQYGETHNGIQAGLLQHQFPKGISAYIDAENPASGLLPGVNADAGGPNGSADDKIQAYCYRMVLTDKPENRVMIEKPEGYVEINYEMLLRVAENGATDFFKLDPMPNRKTDSNNNGAVSTDYIGMNYAYPEADYTTRAQIAKAHQNWQRGLVWTLQNHPRIPEKVREKYAPWGLAKDEFADNDNWPYTLYIREARRMVSDYVVTEPLVADSSSVERSIAMGAYTMDSHNVQRHADADGNLRNEGDVQHRVPGPYRIDYGAIIPPKSECVNLLSPVCVSASHIAFGSIRMEPVFMTLGQSAGAAAAIAVADEIAVQDVPYEKLRDRLIAGDQVLKLK